MMKMKTEKKRKKARKKEVQVSVVKKAKIIKNKNHARKRNKSIMYVGRIIL